MCLKWLYNTSLGSFPTKTDSHNSTQVPSYANPCTANVLNEITNPTEPDPSTPSPRLLLWCSPVEATLLSWLTNTWALEVERCCWEKGLRASPHFTCLLVFQATLLFWCAIWKFTDCCLLVTTTLSTFADIYSYQCFIGTLYSCACCYFIFPPRNSLKVDIIHTLHQL